MRVNHPSLNCSYDVGNTNIYCTSQVLSSQNKKLAFYTIDNNTITVFDDDGKETLLYVMWFNDEIKALYNKEPEIQFIDIKRRDKIFNIKAEDRLPPDYAGFYDISLKTLIEAFKLGYINKDGNWQSSPTISQILKFALQHQDMGDFVFDGHLVYPPHEQFRATISGIGVTVKNPELMEKFRDFCQCATSFCSDGINGDAWWD